MRKWIAIGLALLFCACAVQTTEQNTPEKTARADQPVLPFAVNEVTDTFAWIGKTADEIGAGRTHFDRSGNIAFSGDLFGHTVTGTAYLLTDYEDPNKVYHFVLQLEWRQTGVAKDMPLQTEEEYKESSDEYRSIYLDVYLRLSDDDIARYKQILENVGIMPLS